MSSYTFLYHRDYGSPEIDAKDLSITTATVHDDRLGVDLVVTGLREVYVHELHAPGLRDAEGRPLLHDAAYYTLNRIPSPES